MISIIIPTYNEAENISLLIDEIKRKTDSNIIIVDDNSPDNTAKIASRKNAEVIKNKEKLGLGSAYIKGMSYAIEKGYDILIEMDADFSHDPKYLNEIEDKIKHYDIVIGSRYIKGGSVPKNWAFHRKLISKFGNMILSYFTKCTDSSSGYRAIRKEVFEKIKNRISSYNGYTFQVAFLNEARKAGFKILEIPIEFKERRYGKSKMKIEFILNTLRYILFDSWKK